MKLARLQEAYAMYKDLWILWKNSQLSALSPSEIVIIERYRDAGFNLSAEKPELFYDSREIMDQLITPVAITLESNYATYRRWVVGNFMGFILFIAVEYGWQQFYAAPLDELKIEKALLQKLQLFKCPTVRQIINDCCDLRIMTDAHFAAMLQFGPEILELNARLNEKEYVNQ